jgi:hypothetical protein
MQSNSRYLSLDSSSTAYIDIADVPSHHHLMVSVAAQSGVTPPFGPTAGFPSSKSVQLFFTVIHRF